MIKKMAKEDFNGKTDKFTMDNGIMILNMEVDNGLLSILLTWDNGITTKFKDLVF
jgi:hypothetical protein